jgi:biopolymer transport protein ExbD
MKLHAFRKKKAAANEDVSLNITAMADIFTILLVFLLKSFSTGAIQLSPSKGLLLPEAQAEEASFEALKVEISASAVLIESEPVVMLTAFEFPGKDLNGEGVSKILSARLKKERDRQMAIAQVNKDVKVDPKILIIADQGTPYSTIKSVLASGAVNGYTDFKLAVIKEGS